MSQSHPKLFLSYNHRDKQFARRLAADLQNQGVEVWLDESEIQVGDSLIAKISHAIESVDYVGVILTPNSVESEWVNREVEIALNDEIDGREVKVLPLLREPCVIPKFLKGKLYLDFSDSGYNGSLNRLLKKLGVPQEAEKSRMSAQRQEKKDNLSAAIAILAKEFQSVTLIILREIKIEILRRIRNAMVELVKASIMLFTPIAFFAFLVVEIGGNPPVRINYSSASAFNVTFPNAYLEAELGSEPEPKMLLSDHHF